VAPPMLDISVKQSAVSAFLFFALGAALSGQAHAACPGDTQMEMNECAANDYNAADKELGKFYAKLEKSKELVAAERAWISYRDAECAYQMKAVEGGSMAPMVQAVCLADLTNRRLQQLTADRQN
jgi:uncharacterized protein YecT (DUF1311 family)